ncbi:MAG: hypothetical protein H6608_02855 [Flavobacteriales bacterium]|nr:hypothetical protein [Bacteroidota bacterium]MCB9240047.1 hypothetical protein [Flavobacteriales bacterium]
MKQLIPILILLSACSTARRDGINHASYSDIEQFFKDEVHRNDSLHPQVVKFSEWNGIKKTDTATIESWSEELALFKDFRIPSSVWRTEFELLDSSTDDGITIRSFGAVIPEQIVRMVQVTTDGSGQILRVEGDIRSQNKLSESVRKLSYTANKGYTVAGSRQTKLLKEEQYRIVSQFIKNTKTNL